MLKRIWNFIYKDLGYSIEKRIYYYESEPFLGYIICSDWRFLGLHGFDRIAICHDKKSLDKELELRDINL